MRRLLEFERVGGSSVDSGNADVPRRLGTGLFFLGILLVVGGLGALGFLRATKPVPASMEGISLVESMIAWDALRQGIDGPPLNADVTFDQQMARFRHAIGWSAATMGFGLACGAAGFCIRRWARSLERSSGAFGV